MADQTWTWPSGRVLILYAWSWFDPDLGDVVSGWSRQSEADANGFVHFEAESTRPAETVQIHPDGRDFVFATPTTFSAFTSLPPSLTEQDGRPIAWVRALLGQP